MRADLLTVIMVLDNPCRWASRLRNFLWTEEEILREGVRLITVEIEHGDRAHQLPDRQGVLRIRGRARDMLWRKENMHDIGIAKAETDYIACFDGDIRPVRPGWAAEVVHALQVYSVVQVGSELIYLGPKHEQLYTVPSLVSLYRKQLLKLQLDVAGRCAYDAGDLAEWAKKHGYPGGAWAYRKDALDKLGGLLDCCVCGAGDHHMAMALLGLPDPLAAVERSTEPYSMMVRGWRERAERHIARDVGVVSGTCLHFHHGSTKKRRYPDRWWILQSNAYNPHTDIVYDSNGVLHLTGNKPKLRDDLRLYFEERDEDSTEL